ncbi:TauD/TfdA family dioxygenase [Stutzerimonas stutzeri]|uniref:Taurine catabolism dioxygenase TauD, TfdA family n=1 Tax=Stutzerimonas stutzeri RCH2 TaxID=644801 RepID=L0GGQ0_STUST|nr:TauD/TfdA family dioxygenase [Stutzerimonas stutzeri]AGA84937.1 Taurine catabolism dioxygenase TauD, TfdA family [Stutzerimonas stutzeri RCH2]
MQSKYYETLLANAVEKGALRHEQIGQILNFRLFGNKKGFMTLESLPIGEVPPTPLSRDYLCKPDDSSERLLLQATALLGEPIGYVQESDGCIVNNFFPQQAHSRAATSDSFDTELDLHTENAFHAVLPDYLVLLCLRQDPDAEAVTYIASSERILERLTFEERAFFLTEPYNFLSDYGPTSKNQRIDINRHQTILYGDPDAPFFRFDPQFMLAFSSRAQQLMDKLRAIAWEVVEPVRLNCGDMLIIDNRRSAHARSPFSARFDGSDRWIQRAFAITNPNFYAERLGQRSRVFGLVTEL